MSISVCVAGVTGWTGRSVAAAVLRSSQFRLAAALELAEHLASIAPNQLERPVEDTVGHPDARGAALGGTQVHSVRLPGYVIAVEVLFGLPGERLSIRHDAGNSAEPYVEGTLLAAERAGQITGLVRGLDTLLFG